MSDLKAKDKQYIVNTYSRFDALIVKGKNATCYDENGKEYIDLTSGIGVNSLGFADDDWANAVAEQAKSLQHTSNLFYTEPDIKLAKKLCFITGYDKVFFANSGAEANEGAIKIARKYSFDKYGLGRNKILCFVNSFHGRTVTTLAATGQDVFHNYFFPFTEGFDFVKANDIEDFKAKLDDKVCAVMFEPVQGEGGVLPMNAEFIKEVKSLCDKKDVLIIADEVQTGIGRTGKFLASEYFNITPDLTTLAKGLGGGLPIGAVLCSSKVSNVLSYGDHGTTFGGNPVVCAGSNVCVDKISDKSFLDEVVKKSQYIKDKLLPLDEVLDISGLGLMIGITLKSKSSKDIAAKCVENGLLVLTAKEKVRLLPPLTITFEELEKGIKILAEVLQS